MNPILRCSLINSWSDWSSDWESEYIEPIGGEAPSSRLILRSYGQCGGSVSAFTLLKTSAKLWYFSGIENKSRDSSTVAALAAEMSER